MLLRNVHKISKDWIKAWFIRSQDITSQSEASKKFSFAFALHLICQKIDNDNFNYCVKLAKILISFSVDNKLRLDIFDKNFQGDFFV